MFSHIASFYLFSVFSAAQHPLPLRVLFVCENAVNGDNYSKQNNAPTTHNYATDANYCVSY